MPMAKKWFTFIIVPNANSRLHKVRISLHALHALAAAGFVLFAVAFGLASNYATMTAKNGVFPPSRNSNCGLYYLFYRYARPMKSLCSVLITVVLLMHLQCGAFCLAGSLGNGPQSTPVSTEPPCHQHTPAPTSSPQAPHESNTPCTQGPVLDAKLLLCGKSAREQVTGAVPVTPALLILRPGVEIVFRTHKQPAAPSPPIASSVLRI
jgi:hypothetical protein